MAEFFAGVVRDVVGYFVAEDGGEAVFAGADGENTAEDEDFASVSSLNVLIRLRKMYILLRIGEPEGTEKPTLAEQKHSSARCLQ